MGFFDNTRKPEKIGGKIMVAMMNSGHKDLSQWGFSFLKAEKSDFALDIGCGGGANLKILTKLCTEGKVTGIDYSKVSVDASIKKNKLSINKGKCEVILGNVLDLPFSENTYDIVTAFETIYFWNPIEKAFDQVYRVLKPGGQFLICNEVDGEYEKTNVWEERIQGMKIYTKENITNLLKNSGLVDIQINHDLEKHRLCIIGYKPNENIL